MTRERRHGRLCNESSQGWYWTTWFVAVAFGLNLAWELAHGRLYVHDIPTWIYPRAATADASLIVGALLLVRRWGRGFLPVLVGSCW